VGGRSRALELDVSDGAYQTILAGGVSGGMWRTTDGGANWSPVLRSNTNGNFASRMDVALTADGVVYAALSSNGDRSGIFTSTTGTSGSWTDITPDGWPTSSFERTVFAVNPSDEDEVWALTKASGSGPNGHELWMYDRNTGTWTDSTEYLSERSRTTRTFNSQDGYDLIAEVHPDSSHLVYVGGRNLWRLDVSADSSDGNTWIGGYMASNENLFGGLSMACDFADLVQNGFGTRPVAIDSCRGRLGPARARRPLCLG